MENNVVNGYKLGHFYAGLCVYTAEKDGDVFVCYDWATLAKHIHSTVDYLLTVDF